MQYFDLIIITKNKITIQLPIDYLLINDDFILLDEHHIKINQQIYEFNYLIYTADLQVKYENINILLEENIPVVNFFYQTSIENIYYINKDNYQEIINEIINE